MPSDTPLSPGEKARYDRNIRLQEVGEEGQRKLLSARVLIVGAGGLGCPAALYLAAAGVGTIGICDDDLVELGNLQRQIGHRTEDIGRPKAESLARAITALNPGVRCEAHAMRLTSENARALIEPYDLVIDATDNFPSHFLLGDACVLIGRPLVVGAVLGFEGQITTVAPGGRPCHRCLFEGPPPPGAVPSTAEAGVLGAVPGAIGALQAAEAIKLVLGAGRGLVGSLLVLDMLAMKVRTVPVPANPDCPLCGESPTIASFGGA
jgi:adenylyltransferase/sulfurtransferase